MLGTDPTIFLIRAITLVISLTFHEFAHAWVATRFGDNTPRAYGRLTLNPLRHLDPLGSLLMLVVGFGWAKPVPINPSAMSTRSGVMWTSLAGPFANFLLAIFAAIPLRLGVSFSQSNIIGYFLLNFMEINLLLMLFNLFPIAPLDGEKIAAYVWPPAWSAVLEKITRFGPVLLLVVLFLLPYLGIDIMGAVMTGPLNNLALMLLGHSPILF
jgi:Zn-dependent protease